MQNVLTEFINYDDQAYSYKLESQSIDKSLTVYHYKFHSQKQPSPHDLLFQEDKFSDFNPNPDKSVIGSGMFYNNTRVQVRDMTKQKC